MKKAINSKCHGLNNQNNQSMNRQGIKMIANRVENGQLGEKNSVFIAFYAEPSHLYQTNPDCRAWGAKAWFAKVSLLGVMIRWNGGMGFVGGQVDAGETLIEAALRECSEEIDHTPDIEQLTLVCSHSMEKGDFKQNTHLYVCKVSVDELYGLRQKSVQSYHGRVESAGYVVVHMSPDAPETLLNGVWAGTGKQELEILLNSGLIKKATFEVNDNPL